MKKHELLLEELKSLSATLKQLQTWREEYMETPGEPEKKIANHTGAAFAYWNATTRLENIIQKAEKQ